ncbi:hypothetical protein GT039_24335, partial [Streptomyces sp. SID2955]|nr:hypothetical protein [Streptomyces sp. SID2955]
WRPADPAPAAPGPVGARVRVVHGPGTAELAAALVAEHRSAGDHATAAAGPAPGDCPDVVYVLACEAYR